MALRALVLSVCLASQAVAGVVSRDLFEPGDGLLTYDDVNHREWLDLTESKGTPLDEIWRRIGQGGVWSGFRFAEREDVRRLAESLSAPWSDGWTLPFLEYDMGEELVEMFGVTDDLGHGILGTLKLSQGYVMRTYSNGTYAEEHNIAMAVFSLSEFMKCDGTAKDTLIACRDHEWFDLIALRAALPLNLRANLPAYWLYRDAAPVPEPAAAGLVMLACLLTVRFRRLA